MQLAREVGNALPVAAFSPSEEHNDAPITQRTQVMSGSEGDRPVLFVGLGAIGLPMAVQLAEAGYEVTGVDVSPDRRRAAQGRGIAAVGNVAEAPSSDVAIVMAATASQVESIAAGGGGLFDVMPAGSSCIVMSTVGPSGIERLIAPAARHKIGLVDAPVSGGVSGAEAGTLVVFAAGEDGPLRQVGNVLKSIGNVHQCGARVGQGQSFKLINQLLCSVHLVAAAEAMSLAEWLGLDTQAVHRMIGGGAGASWMLADRGAHMVAKGGGDAAVGTALDIFVKDSDLVVEAARDIGFDAPLVAAANNAFNAAAASGLGRLDDFRVKDIYDKQASSQRCNEPACAIKQ